jgi:glycine oxidase
VTLPAQQLSIAVIGAGITGLWQAFTLARAGHRVTLIEQSPETAPFGHAASWCAGGMLAPFCEEEAAPPLVRELGLIGITLWRELGAIVINQGSLVVASARDLGELKRYQRMTRGSELVDQAAIRDLEPDLADRFASGLYFPAEAHVPARAGLAALLIAARQAGAKTRFGRPWTRDEASDCDWTIDCRGIAASDHLTDLRGVRGEMAVVRTPDISLSRPVRLLHPRFPLYVVPWGDDQFMLGASVVERSDAGPVTLRSTLDLLGSAYTLSPTFAEAEIVELAAGVRPAFTDNVPRIVAQGRMLSVNGMYRHGFLTAPVFAEAVARYIATGETRAEIFVAADRQR